MNKIERIKYYNRLMTYDTKADLSNKVIILSDYKKRYYKLNYRINKAIEYIEENKNKTYAPYGDNEDYDYETCLDGDEIKELLEILKGSDKE